MAQITLSSNNNDANLRVAYANAMKTVLTGGSIVVKSGGGTTLATFTGLAWGTPNATSGVIPLTGLPLIATPVATGIAATYDIRNSSNNISWSGVAGKFAFTVNASTNVLTATSHNFVDGDAVFVSTDGVLPSPLLPSTTYYVINSATNTLKLSATSGGAEIDITDVGAGNNYVYKTTVSLGVIATITSGIPIQITSFSYNPSNP